MNDAGTALRVEVVHAEPERAVTRTFRLTAPATVADVLRLAADCPELAAALHDRCAVGIFGRRVERTEALEDGDRVEIYRPLTADPKQARRARASREPARRPAAG